MIRAVIFDIDNTLYHYDVCNECALDAVRVYAKEKLDLIPQVFDEARDIVQRQITGRLGRDNAAIHSRLIRFKEMLEWLEIPVWPTAAEMNRLFWDTFVARMEPEPGIQDWMAFLHEHQIQIGIGTNMSTLIQMRKLDKLGLWPWISWLLTSEEAGAEKPSRCFFEQCVAKSGFRPEECLFIGDNPVLDTAPAREIGMQSLLYQPAWLSDGCEVAEAYVTSYESIQKNSAWLNQVFGLC